MIKGIYTSASGMVPRVRKQEITANNLSNVRTTGFKKDTMFTRELSKAELKRSVKKSDWEQPMVDQTYVDFSAGIFDKTDNPLDLAIEGDGFFTLQDAQGAIYLTRAGAFEVDGDGFVTFPGGLQLVGEGGAIEVGNGQVTVAQTGEVEVNGTQVSRIAPMTVADTTLLDKIGRSLFSVPDGVELIPAEQPVIRQGYLETANVDMIREMVDMIITFRTYEANAKALQSQDGSLDNLFRRVGDDG